MVYSKCCAASAALMSDERETEEAGWPRKTA
jgi:hypothetical protein